MVTRAEIAKLVPGLDVSDKPHQPILAGLYHPSGGIIRHDAVVWGYARGADRLGIEIHPFTEVTAIHCPGGSIEAVVTSKGSIATPIVINATAGWCSTIAHMVDASPPSPGDRAAQAIFASRGRFRDSARLHQPDGSRGSCYWRGD